MKAHRMGRPGPETVHESRVQRATSRWTRFSFALSLISSVLFSCATSPAGRHTASPTDERTRNYLGELQQQARQGRLWDTRMWQVLLHYRRTWGGGWRSEADGAGFFNAPSGRTDPEAELLATLAAFAEPERAPAPDQDLEHSQHPQCKFPARWTWLKQTLKIDPQRLPDQPCPFFSRWRQAFAAQKVHLVYASAYVNSPASMYGHTFLRLTRGTGEGNPLLDYIVNFAADANTSNGLVYAWNGVFGGFKGHFYVMPYYVKIQEYSNMESRDLWEYELSLSQEQSERLVQHTWETRNTHFNYYFFTENCSYFLLGLLEVADPNLHLVEAFSGTTIPSNTVREILAVKGLVKDRKARPSLRATMFAQKRSLTAAAVNHAEALAKSGRAEGKRIESLDNPEQARVLDAAYARLRYKEGFTWPPTASFETKERDLLVMRGRTGVPPQDVQGVRFVEAPETGHDTFRVGVAGGTAFDLQQGDLHGRFVDLAFRVAIHDYLDPPAGYPEDALLEMMNVRLRLLVEPYELLIDRINLLNIVSAAPVDSWLIQPSWKVWAGGGQAYELGCLGWDCLFGGVNTGGGFAWRPWSPILLWLMADMSAQGGAPFEHGVRMGGGGSLGSAWRWGRWAQTELTAQYIRYLLGDTRSYPLLSFGHAFNLGRRLQARLAAESYGRRAFGRLELIGYF